MPFKTSYVSRAAVTGALIVIAAGGASAQDGAADPGVYVSGGATYLRFEGDNGVDAEVNALTGRLGAQLNSWLSVEGDASFGFEDSDFTFDGSEDDFDLDDNSDGDVADVINAPGDFGLDYMLGAYVRASLPVSDVFEISGRAGYAFAEVQSTVLTPGGSTIELGDSESGASFGAGASLYLTERQALRVDYTYTDFDLAEAQALGLMYQFKF